MTTERSSCRVSLVLVTYNSARDLPGFFAALPSAVAGVDCELVIADNASTDNTLAVLAELATEATVVALQENGGYAAGINAAMAVADPTATVLVLNSDIRLHPGSVARLLEACSQPGVGIAVPRILGADGTPQRSLRREPSVQRALAEAVLGGRRAARLGVGEVVDDTSAYEREHDVDWASGAAMMITRACLDKVGRFDESFFLYSEETDFALRARDAGLSTRFVPSAEVTHLGGEMETSPRLWAIAAVNRVRLFRRRHGSITSGMYWFAIVLNELLRTLAGRPTSRAALQALIRPSRRPPEVDRDTEPAWLAFSGQDWWYHNQAHSDFQLLRRVAQHRTVLLVNSIGMRVPMPGRTTQVTRRIGLKLRSIAKLIRRPLPDTPRFHVFTPLTVPAYGTPVGRALNARLVRLQVALAARWVGLGRSPVVFVTIPTAWEVVRDLPRRSLVVNRSDKHSAFGEAPQSYIRSLEIDLIEHADAVCYVSRSLMDDERQHAGDRGMFLDHGVDLEHFRARAPSEQPRDLRALPRPRVGFFGGLEDYLVDFALLERVAAEIPEAQLVLIGDATSSLDTITRHPNAHWLGFKPYEQIPLYGSGFDVALMPWLDNHWIRHSNPIKLKEYLALGLAVVTTDFPEARHYADWIAIADDADAFISAVRDALSGGGVSTPSERRAAVAGASWDVRANELLRVAERRFSRLDTQRTT